MKVITGVMSGSNIGLRVGVDDTMLGAAAPDLLAALQQCLVDIEAQEQTHGRNFAAGNVARNAIEKATGSRPAEVV